MMISTPSPDIHNPLLLTNVVVCFVKSLDWIGKGGGGGGKGGRECFCRVKGIL